MTVNQSWPLPDISEERIVDFDLFNVEPINGDLHAGWHTFTEYDDLFYTPLNGGHWVVNSAALMEKVMEDSRTFSNRGVSLTRDVETMHFKPGGMDPPEHTGYRMWVQPQFMPSALKRFEENSRNYCRELIEDLGATGEADFQEKIGGPLPVRNFLSFVNLPLEDTDFLLSQGQVISRSHDMTERGKSYSLLWDYMAEKISERQKSPSDDFIGHIASTNFRDGTEVPLKARCDTAVNVTLGGLDTTSASMGFAMNYLARHPGHRQCIVEDPGIIPQAIEELLRRHAVLNPGRLVTGECELDGVKLRKNDLVLCAPALANLDERRYPQPLTADFNRKNIKHLTFSKGIHLCIGMHFARLQMKILLEEWFKRIPDFGVAPGGKSSLASGHVNAVYKLPLTW